eukprot:EC125224.1.p1 GENE.EC125224.1~~EC125224.1.p1  ORF type:complete len:136 (+),score=13.92 EC125224.1:335-742(+)
MKLPKKIRAMPLKQFYDVHACDVDSVIFNDVKTIGDEIYSQTPQDRKSNLTRVASTPKTSLMQATTVFPTSLKSAGQSGTKSAVIDLISPSTRRNKENSDSREENVEGNCQEFAQEDVESSTEGSVDVSAPKTPR